MTATTLVRPLPESAEPDNTTTQPRPAHTPAPAPSRRTPKTRRDLGFSMLELLVGMVILGVLGAIGYGIYTNFIRDARDTALDQNIQTAAAEMQSVLALEPTLASTANRGSALVTALTSRTNFVWNTTWDFDSSGNEPDVIRYEFLTDGGPTQEASGTAGAVTWLVDGSSAVRIHTANPEGEWRCALLILKPSNSDVKALETTANPIDDASAAAYAAEMRGIWYDGGTSLVDDGLYQCSPVSSRGAGTWTGKPSAAGPTCLATGTLGVNDDCLPFDAQTWQIPVDTGDIDSSSTAVTAGNIRTLHRSASSLDSNA